jgi:peptide/nickel transport system permease protein
MKLVRTLSLLIVKATLVVLAVTVINFLLVRMAPGDPVSVLAGEAGAADQQYIDQLRKDFNLDKPIAVQLASYMGSVMQLDLGYSYRQKRPVIELITERLPATLLLAVPAFCLSLAGGIFLGVLASVYRGTWKDSAITTASLTFYATPIFWVGLMLVLLFSVQLKWFPPFGFEQLGQTLTGWRRALDIAHHAVLPIITLAAFNLALYARMTRASMNEVQTSDFVKTAWAKGLNSGRVIWVHQLRNAVLPVITLAGIQAGQLIGGSVLVETVFAWPGVGRLAFDALLQRDYMVLMGVFFCTSIVVVVFNLVTDMLYMLVDPRIRSAA